jgi:hypothetical protein
VPGIEKIVYRRAGVPGTVPEIDPAAVELVGNGPVHTPPRSSDCSKVNHNRDWAIPIEVILKRGPKSFPPPGKETRMTHRGA